MQYTLLGTSGLRVSDLALGTMTFGEDWGWGAGRDACEAIFERYVEAGGNFLDTANVYTNGTSEEIVGDLLGDRRDEFVLATKYTLNTREGDPNAGGNHRKNLMQSVDASLERLGTDSIDLLWVHAWDGLTPIEEVMRGLDDLVSMGKVNYLGISDAPAWVVADAQRLALERHWAPLSAIQIKYTLTERTPERELLPMARALGLGVVVWSPLDGGLLTGKYADGAEGRLTATDRQISDQESEIAREVVSVAAELDVSPAQVALAWIRERPGQTIPIVGATTPEHVDDNLGSLDLVLENDHRDRLDQVSAVELGFPHDFLGSEQIERVIFGGTRDDISPYDG